MSDDPTDIPAVPPWRRRSLVLGLLALLAIFLLSGFREDAVRAVSLLSTFAESGWALPIAAIIFLVGSLFLVPQWALIAGAISAFGFLEGGLVAWACTTLCTSLHLGAVAAFRDRIANRFHGERMQTFRALFSRNSFQSGLIIRVIPSGPFLLVNVAAGLAGVRVFPFMIGTMVGIIPKIVLIGLVTQGLVSTARGQQIGLGLTLVAVGVIGGWWMWRRVRAVRHAIGDK